MRSRPIALQGGSEFILYSFSGFHVHPIHATCGDDWGHVAVKIPGKIAGNWLYAIVNRAHSESSPYRKDGLDVQW